MDLLERLRSVLESGQNNILGKPLSEAIIGVQEIVYQMVAEAGLPNDIATRYNKFADDEKSFLYLSGSYRDHFFHPFHVFLLGFLIIRNLELSFENSHELSPLPLEDVFLKKWLITSLWHDITYATAKGPEWLAAFIRARLKVQINASQNWLPLMEKKEVISAIDRLAAKFDSSDHERRLDFRTWINRQLLEKHDHGILSAILLIMDNKNKSWGIDDQIIDESSLAIALHNYHKSFYYDLIQDQEDSKSPSVELGKLSIKKYKLAYILSYCDTAQEWGRPSLRHPKTFISYSKIAVDTDNKDIEIFLNYDVPAAIVDNKEADFQKAVNPIEAK